MMAGDKRDSIGLWVFYFILCLIAAIILAFFFYWDHLNDRCVALGYDGVSHDEVCYVEGDWNFETGAYGKLYFPVDGLKNNVEVD